MVQIIPRMPTFGERFAQTVGGQAQQSLANVPQMAMMLAGMRRERQQEGMQTAQNIAQLINREATGEEQAQLMQRAAQMATQGKSPADIAKELTSEATKQAEYRSALESLPEAGIIGNIKNLFAGKGFATKEQIGRTAEAMAKGRDIKVAREKLAKKGLSPEEIELRVSKLSEPVTGIVKGLPDLKKVAPEEKPETLARYMQGILKTDPNANLVVLRDKLSDKGVEWSEFRDTLFDLVQSGQIELTPEQANMVGILDRPSEKMLKEVLKDYRLARTPYITGARVR